MINKLWGLVVTGFMALSSLFSPTQVNQIAGANSVGPGDFPGVYNATTTDVVINNGYGGSLAVDQHGRILVSPSSSVPITLGLNQTFTNVSTTNLYVSGTANIPGISSGNITSTNFFNSGQFTNDGSVTLNGTTTVNSAGGLVVNGPFTFTTGAGVITNITSTNIFASNLVVSSTLTVNQTSTLATTTATGVMTLIRTVTGGVDNDILVLKNLTNGSDTRMGLVFQDYQGNPRAKIQAVRSATANAAHDLLFFTSNVSNSFAERMRITGAGFVGIGTSSPTAMLQVATTTVNATTTFKVGKPGTKGSCLELNAVDGTLYNLVLNAQGGFVTSTGACSQ